MTKLNAVGVFCGSRNGNDPKYINAITKFGEILGEEHIELIYGAGHTGMMGAVAKGALSKGGIVTGVINSLLQSLEKQSFDLTNLRVYPSLHERKDVMFQTADAFVGFPGGIGTLDEIFEVVTLKQINEINKPIILCNINGFWNPFKEIIDGLIRCGYADEKHRNLVTYVNTPEEILPAICKELTE